MDGKQKYADNTNGLTTKGNIINTTGSVTYPWYGSDFRAAQDIFCAKKWRDPNLTGNYGNPAKIFGDQNQILLRYAEVILSRAECKVHTGDVAGAMADLKLVRDRAWGGTSPANMQDSANYDGTPGQLITDPLQMVLSEYRHELEDVLENILCFMTICAGQAAMLRLHSINTANGTVDKGYNPVPNPAPGPTHDGKVHGLYNTSITSDKTILPIPQGAIAFKSEPLHKTQVTDCF